MVQVLLILLFASLHLFDGLGSHAALDLPSWQAVLLTTGPIVVMWGVFQLLCIYWGRQLDRKGRFEVVRTADLAMLGLRLLAGAWWGFGVFALGSLSASRREIGDWVMVDELLTLAPMLLFIAATWWSMYPLELRLREAVLMRELNDGSPVHAPLSRVQFVSSCVRHQAMLFLAPLTLMTTWQETMVMHVSPWMVRTWSEDALWLAPLVEYAGIIGVLVTCPAIIRRIWDTVEIGAGPLRDQMRAMCRQYGVRVRGPLLWRTHGSMVNGAILGVFWPLRYMLLSDALLERLTGEQVEAVMAHEVAHVRRRHLVWLAVCVVSSVLLLAVVVGGIIEGFNITAISSSALSIIMGLLGIAGAGMVFGAVSRRFEWQADAFAVQHLSRIPAGGSSESKGAVTAASVQVMASALQSVADLNGIDPEGFTWRHGSVRERQRRLGALIDRPLNALPIDRQVRFIKVAAVAGIVISLVPMVMALLNVSGEGV